jgi:hypothetical protein
MAHGLNENELAAAYDGFMATSSIWRAAAGQAMRVAGQGPGRRGFTPHERANEGATDSSWCPLQG